MPPVNIQYALPPGARIGKYVIQRALGAGGFGITYVAEDPANGKMWAIKEFYPREFCTRSTVAVTVHTDIADSSYQFALQKFLMEAELLYGFSHPNIVGVHEHPIETNNTAYIVMDFIEGLSFEARLKASPQPPSEAEIRPIFEKVLNAVGYLHDQNFMHRDLSPENIMIKPDGEPVLIDFGTMGEGLSRGASTIQFRRDDYSPPEQGAEGLEQGAYTDIFALGGVLYRAVTGKPPVKSTVRSAKVLQGKPDPYVPVSQAAPNAGNYSPAFLNGIDHALVLNSEARPQSIAAWQGLLGWAGGEATVVAPPTTLAPKGAAETVLATQTAKKSGSGKAAVLWGVAALSVLSVAAMSQESVRNAIFGGGDNTEITERQNNLENGNDALLEKLRKQEREAARQEQNAQTEAERKAAEQRRLEAKRRADELARQAAIKAAAQAEAERRERERLAKIREAEEARKRAEQEAQRQADAREKARLAEIARAKTEAERLRLQAEAEKKRLAELQKAREEAERLRLAREAEERRLAALKKAREEAERLRQLRLAEEKRLEELRRAREAEEARRKERDRLARLEQERRRLEETRRQEDEARRRREEEERRRKELEENQTLRVAVYDGIDFDGYRRGIDVAFHNTRTWQACAKLCRQNSRCRQFTFNTAFAGKRRSCVLKSGSGRVKVYRDAISGILFRGNPNNAPRLSGRFATRRPDVFHF